MFNAQNFLETARSIKSNDELICMEASLRNAENGIHLMHEKLEANMTEEELWAYLHKVNIETKMIKNCGHHIPIEASSIALNYIKKNLYL